MQMQSKTTSHVTPAPKTALRNSSSLSRSARSGMIPSPRGRFPLVRAHTSYDSFAMEASAPLKPPLPPIISAFILLFLLIMM